MWNTQNTADVKGLEGFTFSKIRVLTYGQGIITTHGWVHGPSGADAHGFGSKAEAVASARRYRDAWREEQGR